MKQIRVSSRISNSQIILNLDCDHYSNNSESVRDALCFFMDEKQGHNIGFVQYPQHFDNLTKNDLYGNCLRVPHQVNLHLHLHLHIYNDLINSYFISQLRWSFRLWMHMEDHSTLAAAVSTGETHSPGSTITRDLHLSLTGNNSMMPCINQRESWHKQPSFLLPLPTNITHHGAIRFSLLFLFGLYGCK